MPVSVTGGMRLGAIGNLITGVPVVDGPNPLGAIRSSNSSIWTSWISSFIFVSPFLPFLDSPQKLKPKTASRNHFRFPQFRLSFFLPARRAFRNRPFGNGIVVVVVVGIGRVVMQRPDCGGSNPLFQLFHVHLNLVFHFVAPFLFSVSPTSETSRSRAGVITQ